MKLILDCMLVPAKYNDDYKGKNRLKTSGLIAAQVMGDIYVGGYFDQPQKV